MKISMLMLVERDPWGQFTGVIFQEGHVRPGCFSGTAELIKVMEDVLPLERPLVESARSERRHADDVRADPADDGAIVLMSVRAGRR